jgi:hypothetical protein
MALVEVGVGGARAAEIGQQVVGGVGDAVEVIEAGLAAAEMDGDEVGFLVGEFAEGVIGEALAFGAGF